jgi:hypothetical protein
VSETDLQSCMLNVVILGIPGPSPSTAYVHRRVRRVANYAGLSLEPRCSPAGDFVVECQGPRLCPAPAVLHADRHGISMGQVRSLLNARHDDDDEPKVPVSLSLFLPPTLLLSIRIYSCLEAPAFGKAAGRKCGVAKTPTTKKSSNLAPRQLHAPR